MSIQMQTSSFSSARAWRGRALAIAAAAALTAPSMAGCTSKQVNSGDSPAYLIVNSLQAASGAEPTKLGTTLASDVETLVKAVGPDGNPVVVKTIFEDVGQMDLTLALKDPGSSTSPNAPTSANFITLTRYHVQYVRTDGHNTEGVDVPYSFDGVVTGTVSGNNQSLSFIIVRSQAKTEAPLRALVDKGASNTISTIANITFYGADQAGRAVTVTGSLSIEFANWADPS